MENIVENIVTGVVVIAAMICLVKCAYAPGQDKKINGDYYDVIQLNDTTYLLNPTLRIDGAEPKIVSKDSLGFHIKTKGM